MDERAARVHWTYGIDPRTYQRWATDGRGRLIMGGTADTPGVSRPGPRPEFLRAAVRRPRPGQPFRLLYDEHDELVGVIEGGRWTEYRPVRLGRADSDADQKGRSDAFGVGPPDPDVLRPDLDDDT